MEKWFKLIENLEGRRQRTFFATKVELPIDPTNLKKGKVVSSWGEASLRCDEKQYDGKLASILGNVAMIPVFSAALRFALESNKVAIDDIQWLSVSVIDSKGVSHTGFSIANVVSRIPALDRVNCVGLMEDECEMDPTTKKCKVLGMARAALKLKALKGHDIIRLKENFPPVYVSKRFKDLYEKNRFTGGLFQEVIVT